MLTFASDSRVDVENRDLTEGTMLLIKATEELRHVLAAFVDGHRGQTLFLTHVVAELFDHVRVRRAGNFRLMQATEEGDPLPCMRNEAQLPMAEVDHVGGLGLTLGPSIGSPIDLLLIDLSRCF